MAVEIPEDLAADPVQSKIWAEIAPEGNRFEPQDVPSLRLLCFWHAVAREAQRQMGRGGKLALFDPIALKPFTDASGKAPYMVRKSPALTVLSDATKEIRALSDALGITPSARSRMGAETKVTKDSSHGKLLLLMQDDRAAKERRAAAR